MLQELYTPPSETLYTVLHTVQLTGDPIVLYPSTYLGDLETIAEEVRKRGLRIANVPTGALTILPMIPVAEQELLDLCRAYCTATDEAARGEFRRQLYIRDYPLFNALPANHGALYHPADYLTRIAHLCYVVCRSAKEQLPLLFSTSPYLHIAPISQICSILRAENECGCEALTYHGDDDNNSISCGAAGGGVTSSSLHSFATSMPALSAAHDSVSHTNDNDELRSVTPMLGEETVLASEEVLLGNCGALFREDALEADEAEVNARLAQEDLTGEEIVDEVHAAECEYLHEADLELVEDSSVHYDGEADGRRKVAVFIRNAIRPELCAAAAAALEPAATKRNLRRLTNGGTPPDTGIVGYYDYLNNPTAYKCRETQYFRDHWRTVKDGCEEFLRCLDALYAQHAPQHYQLQKLAIPAAFQLFGTAFSTMTVNHNFRTAVHTDRGDFRSGLGALCVVKGNFEGCHLGIKKLKKAFPLRVGDVLFFDTFLEHGNTEVHTSVENNDWTRISLVCYLRTGLLSPLCEMERRRHLNRQLLQRLTSTQRLAGTLNINAADPALPALYVPGRLTTQLATTQLAALGFVIERTHKESGCVVAMTMGLGKTLVALTLCYSYSYGYPHRDILVVVPKPILPQWADEYGKWHSYGLHFRHFVLADTEAYNRQLLEYEKESVYATRDSRIFILNPECLGNFLARFTHFDPILIIADEGHRVASKYNKLIENLARLPCRRRIVLSGTPVQNDAEELYRLVSWVDKGVSRVFPARRFSELAADVERYVKGDDAAFPAALAAQEFIQEWMKGFVFREMEYELPPLHDYLLICGDSQMQQTLQARHLGLTLHVDSDDITSVSNGQLRSALATMSATEHWPYHLSTHPLCYLAFISNGYGSMIGAHGKRSAHKVTEEDDADGTASSVSSCAVRPGARRLLTDAELDFAHECLSLVRAGNLQAYLGYSGKLTALRHIVDHVIAHNEKVIIFSQYIGVQDLIHRTLSACEIAAFTVRGRDGVERRQKAIRDFRDNAQLHVLVLSTKIAAYGLDFTVANHVVLFDSWWNPQVDAQAIARAYRRNQRRPVTVYRLASAFEDRSTVRTQTRKMALFDCLMREKTSRVALPSEITDCAEDEADDVRRALWRKLKATKLNCGTNTLLNVYQYRDRVKETLH